MPFDFDQDLPPACPDVPGSSSGRYGDPAETAQLLDDHHLVVTSVDGAVRARFARALVEQLAALPDAEVLEVDGKRVADLDALCRQLDRRDRHGGGAAAEGWTLGRDAGPIGRWSGARRRIDPTVDGVIEFLRAGSSDRKHQFFVWHDAGTLLMSDPALFGRIVNAFLAVAAEREFVTSEVLLLQRVVFLGGVELDAYAGDRTGQFRSWLLEEDSSPFWEVVSCVERPRVLAYRLDG